MNFVLPSSSPIRLAPSFWLQRCTISGRSEIEESSITMQDPSKRSVLSCTGKLETRYPSWALNLQSQKPRGICGTWTTCSLFLLCFGLCAASIGLRGGIPGAGFGLYAAGLDFVFRGGAPPSQMGVGCSLWVSFSGWLARGVSFKGRRLCFFCKGLLRLGQ
ncbi:hypothetical protein OIU78_018518 [Salix suchowensis]|nr:hypothetical protein OIU78_018518 [Salix suchowensis]